MHYMKWTRVMLLVVFEEFKVVYIFFATFFFSLSLSIVKGLAKIFSKNLGRLQPPPPLPARLVFTGLYLVNILSNTCRFSKIK